MDIVSAITIFAIGMLSGVILVRYGIKVGIKTVYLIREEIPLDELKPTEQEMTGD